MCAKKGKIVMKNAVRNDYRESVFTGSMFGLLGVDLATVLITGITLGMAYPWVHCWRESWFKSHTYINGRQLCFNGTGMQLIGNWLKWMLLSVITLGIYSLWLPIKIEQWTVKHTYFADEAMVHFPEEAGFNFIEWIDSVANSVKRCLQKLWGKLDNWANSEIKEDFWVCSNGHRNNVGNRFCNVCGEQKPREIRCPNCGALLTVDAKFCGACAFPVNRQ